MIPFLLVVLWFQAGAKGRLLENGLVPYPDIRHAVGLSVGTGKDNPCWVFQAEPSPKTGLDFYDSPNNRTNWDILSRNKDMLILRKGDQSMIISIIQFRRSRLISYLKTSD
jgi:hypothetical protein